MGRILEFPCGWYTGCTGLVPRGDGPSLQRVWSQVRRSQLLPVSLQGVGQVCNHSNISPAAPDRRTGRCTPAHSPAENARVRHPGDSERGQGPVLHSGPVPCGSPAAHFHGPALAQLPQGRLRGQRLDHHRGGGRDAPRPLRAGAVLVRRKRQTARGALGPHDGLPS